MYKEFEDAVHADVGAAKEVACTPRQPRVQEVSARRGGGNARVPEARRHGANLFRHCGYGEQEIDGVVFACQGAERPGENNVEKSGDGGLGIGTRAARATF
ncbi:hypothetical protein PybrP1_000282 [[Pythium] brassicae (nom. inval.)]|nr:hypothetical protein PybrP1_000282 [[Pythium] brassicae (nom. inval.)]